MIQAKLCYYNGHWNVYLYTTIGYSAWVDDYSTQTKRILGGEYRLRTYPKLAAIGIPAQSFGFMSDDPKQRPGHGGEWSSNSKSINAEFGTKLWGVAIDQTSMSVPLPWLKELLGDRLTWQADDIYGEIITHIDGEENKWHKWITIKEFATELA